jgi:zinc transport system substrate-binding protein
MYAQAADVPKVAVSIKPVHSLVAAVMQGIGEPTLILEGAGSPHSYALKPSQAESLQQSDMVFWIGEGMENFLAKPLSTLSNSASIVSLATSPGVALLKVREAEPEAAKNEEDHDHSHGEMDLHLWLDPQNAKAMTLAIADELSKKDPGNQQVYMANAMATAKKLDALTTELTSLLAPERSKPFVMFHDAFQYFENRFGLTETGSIVLNPEVSPSAERIRAIRQRVQKSGAVCIFSEPQFEPRIIQTVIEGTSAGTSALDPLGADIAAGPEQYFQMMHELGTSFTNCMQGNS